MEIEINGCVEVQDKITVDEFSEKLIDFLESNGWYFGGSIDEYKEGEK